MNPIILYDNRFQDAIPTATGTATGFDVLNIRDLRPYTWWKALAAGTNYITVNCGSGKPADCLALGGHNFHTAGAQVSVESSADNITWTPRTTPLVPPSDGEYLSLFSRIYAPWLRLKIVTVAVAPFVAVAMIGARLEFPFPPDSSYIPYSESVEEESSTSKNGNCLGSVIRYFPIEINPQFSYPDREWVDGEYKAFWNNHAKYRRLFFWAWDLDVYPEQVFLVKHTGRFDPGVSVLAYYDHLKLNLKGAISR